MAEPVLVTWDTLDTKLQLCLIGTTVTAVTALLLSFIALCKTFGGCAGCLRLGAAAAKDGGKKDGGKKGGKKKK